MQWTRRTIALAVLVGLIAIAAAAGAYEAFAPERATHVEADPTMSTPPDAVHATGTFQGRTGHHVSGSVALVQRDGAWYLEFTDYEQTQGPDVYVYLTPSPSPDSRSEIAAGVRILIDGGADGGESTKTGTFAQRLPDGVDPNPFAGVGIWCDRFSTPFGFASLTRA